MSFLGYHKDESLPFSEEVRFKSKNRTFVTKYARKLQFSDDIMVHIMLIYYKMFQINRNKGIRGVLKHDLNNILHNGLDLTNNDLNPNIISVIDKTMFQETSLKDWVKMVTLFLKGTEEEKIKFAYDVYLNKAKSRILNRSRLVFILRGSFIDEDDESLKDFVDIIMKKLDVDQDGIISFAEFRKVMLGCPLFLQSLGQILPERLATNAFSTTFTETSTMI